MHDEQLNELASQVDVMGDITPIDTTIDGQVARGS